jgi:NAD(P)H-hydrate epimerase
MRLPTRLLQRKPDSHKGDFGHILIVAGSTRFSGAAILCAEAAMRSGAGLVTLAVPKSIHNAVLKLKLREVMTLPLPDNISGEASLSAFRIIKDFLKKIDLLVIGPGMGRQASTQNLIKKIIAQVNIPLVIDADGINALTKNPRILLRNRKKQRREIIITPHLGEMARLLGLTTQEVQKKRKLIASGFARKYGLTIVLKGHNSIVADSKNLYTNKTGNPGMSTAGSGDVLTGLIAAFFAQRLNAFNAAKYAVYLHGLAGDIAAKEKTQISLIASDIIAKIPEAIKRQNRGYYKTKR